MHFAFSGFLNLERLTNVLSPGLVASTCADVFSAFFCLAFTKLQLSHTLLVPARFYPRILAVSIVLSLLAHSRSLCTLALLRAIATLPTSVLRWIFT